jgi:iron(III) transport system substrate-binding protein
MENCMSERGIAYVIVSFLLLLLSASAPEPLRAQADHAAKLLEGAKKEGAVAWYTSMNVNESKPLLDDFEKQYPFIKVDLFRSSGEKVLNRVTTETRAGRWSLDVVGISEIGTLIEQKLISAYFSPESKAYLKELKDPQGYWNAVYINYYIPGYNTRMVSDPDAPKRWEDFLDPKWKDKISIDPEDYPWYVTLLAAWGKEKTDKYMKALARQNIQWRKGHALIAQLMSAGEFPLGIVYAHRMEADKKKGAPVEWVNTVDPVVASVNSVGVSAKPAHPNAARLFVDFILSKKSQERIRSFSRVPARGDVEPPYPKMDQKNLKLRVVPHDTATRYNEYVKDFRAIFGL